MRCEGWVGEREDGSVGGDVMGEIWTLWDGMWSIMRDDLGSIPWIGRA